MSLEEFDFTVPSRLVAQRPAPERAGSRLMQVPLSGAPTVGPFSGVLDAFCGDEVLVLNDTRVVPARLHGTKRTGGAVEVLFVEPTGPTSFKAMVRGKRLRPGTALILPGTESATLTRRHGDRTVEVAVEGVDDLWRWLETHGEVPLPPYIQRTPDEADQDRYQSVFARARGAVAAPTASLHFTAAILDALRAKGVVIETLTLHVGLGTFLPVKTPRIEDHVMHFERYAVPPQTAAAVASGRPVVAVGTTVVRALEAHARDPHAHQTDLFILPGFDFLAVDGMLTNFHLPQSTLLMLVSAFAGRDRIRAAYARAVAEEMRFYSYGDAMLLRREGGRWT
jgi:S-adenosylmethionine:tRNA ribosyltransferase-isomerase